LAKQRNLKQLWLNLPVDLEKAKPLLEAAIQEGKTQGVAIYGVLRLMEIPNSEQPFMGADSDIRDINVLGETTTQMLKRNKGQVGYSVFGWSSFPKDTGDAVRPDAPLTIPILKKRLMEVGTIPGLSGLVLRGITTPGYNALRGFFDTSSTYNFGYTLERRLENIRKNGYDPIDLGDGSSSVGVNLTIPLFTMQGQRWIEHSDGSYGPDPKHTSPLQEWNKLRYKINLKMLTELYKQVRPELPSQLRLLAVDAGSIGDSSWYGSWDEAEKVPRNNSEELMLYVQPTASNYRRPVAIARDNSKTVYGSVSISRQEIEIRNIYMGAIAPGTPLAFTLRLNQFLEEELKQKDTWDGLVMDLSELPYRQVEELVLGALAVPD
jgi:hypothetical protein